MCDEHFPAQTAECDHRLGRTARKEINLLDFINKIKIDCFQASGMDFCNLANLFCTNLNGLGMTSVITQLECSVGSFLI